MAVTAKPVKADPARRVRALSRRQKEIIEDLTAEKQTERNTARKSRMSALLAAVLEADAIISDALEQDALMR